MKLKLNPNETNQKRLRWMCMHLPTPVVPNFQIGGTRKKKGFLKAARIRALIKRQLTELKSQADASNREARQRPPDLVAHAFWTSATSGPQAALRETRLAGLTPLNALGLQSALAVGFRVHLWTYHQEALPGLPVHDRLHVEDARRWVTEAQFMYLLKAKWPWGNIADVIRFRAAKAANSSMGVWILDLDTLWLRAPTTKNVPSVTGHIFATGAARRRQSGDAAYWRFRYLVRPMERTNALPPFYFPPRSVILEEVCCRLWDSGAPPKVYTKFLNDLEEIAIKHGCGGSLPRGNHFSPCEGAECDRHDFQEPIKFNAVHCWVPVKALAEPVAERAEANKCKIGWPLNTADDVLASAVALNCPWQTSAPKAGPERRPDRIGKVTFLKGSFLHRVFQQLPLGTDALWAHLSPAALALLSPALALQCPATLGVKRLRTNTTREEGGEEAEVEPEDPGLRQILATLVDMRGTVAMADVWANLPRQGRQRLQKEIDWQFWADLGAPCTD